MPNALFDQFAREKWNKETSNFWLISWTNPIAKSANFSTSKYQLICRLEKGFLCQERFWTLSFNNLNQKKRGEETSIFDQKYELSPFVKIKILQLLISTFYWSKKLFFYQGHCQTLYLINMAEKSEGKETSNFWSKSSTNPFAKKANFSTSNYQLMWSLERGFLNEERH